MEKGEIEKIVEEMNPHFIFNALNTMKCRSMMGEESVPLLIDALSKYLRFGFCHTGREDLVSFREELEFTKNYLFLEKARFSGMTTEYNIAVKNFHIVAGSMQKAADWLLHVMRCQTRKFIIRIMAEKEIETVKLRLVGESIESLVQQEQFQRTICQKIDLLDKEYSVKQELNGNLVLERTMYRG